MAKPFPSKTHIGNHMLHPETLMLNYGYDPQLSEGAVKPPVFLTSTFVFRTAEDGQDFFDYVSGRREPPEGMGAGLVYSRFNHPNSEIVEDRLADLRAHREMRAVLLRHVGDFDHDPRLRPPRRRHPALAAALWRDRNPVHEDACGPLDRRGRFCRRHRRGRGQAGGGGRHAQGPGFDDLHRNPGQSHQRPGRYRDGPPHRRHDRQGAGAHADHRLRQYAARAGVSAADRTWRGFVAVFADQIYRRPFRPDRGRSARLKGADEGRQGAARRHRHPTRSAFLLDALPVAGNTEHPHGKSRPERAAGGGFSARPRQGGEGSLPGAPRRGVARPAACSRGNAPAQAPRSRSTLSAARPPRSNSSTRCRSSSWRSVSAAPSCWPACPRA